MLVVQNSSDSSSNRFASMTSVEKDFNQYANYLLYGKNSNKSLDGTYDAWTTYTLDEQVDLYGNLDKNYWEKAEELLDATIEKYDGLDTKDKNQTLEYTLVEHREVLRFLVSYMNAGIQDTTQLLDMVVSSGQTAALNSVESFTSDLAGYDTIFAEEYIAYRTAQYTALAKLYALYNDAGCIINRIISETCTINDADTVDSLIQEVDENEYYAEGTIQNAVSFLASGCWDISEQIKHPVTLSTNAGEME